MTRYVLRRLLGLAATILVALTVLFGLLHASPTSPVHSLPPAVAADPQARAEFEAQHDLDQPLVVQYGRYVGRAVRGDLGTSIVSGQSVSSGLGDALPVSLELGLLASLVAVIPGLLVGVAAARFHGRAVDGAARLVTLVAISVPSYWLAVIGLVVVGERYPDLLPSAGGFERFGDNPAANLKTLLLPAFVLGLAGFSMIARSVRTSLIEIYERDEVRFARAMGLPEREILRRIALRAAAPSTITVLGLVVATLVSGTVLVEHVFQLPGMGQLMVHAFVRQDYPVALGASLVTAVLFLGLNLVVDLAVHALDPRAATRTTPARVALRP